MSTGSQIPILGQPQFNTPVDAVLVASVVLTPAQIKAFDHTAATSVTIVPAPLPNQIIEVISYSVNMQFPSSGGIAYTGTTTNIVLGPISGGVQTSVWATLISTLNTAASQYSSGSGAILGGFNTNTFTGLPLTINVQSGGAIAAGNSPVVVTVRYRLVNVQ
jgi:hypothetical protein